MIVDRMLPLARQKLVTIGDDAPLIDAAKLLNHRDANLVVVCEADQKIAGVIAKTDIVREISHCHGRNCTAAATMAMTRDVVFCRREDFLKDVWAAMKSRGLKHIPVIDDERHPVGLLIARDVLTALLEETEYEQQLLLDYVMCIGYH